MYKFLICIIFTILLNSCIATAIGGGIVATARVYQQDKSMGDILDDSITLARIKSELFKQNYGNIDVVVNQGEVLLTGHVKNHEIRNKIEHIISEIKGVEQVINRIKTGNYDTKASISDKYITVSIKSELLLAKKINSANYSITTSDGIVYLMGIAANRQKIDQVTQIASRVKGVKKVISYIRLNKLDKI